MGLRILLLLGLLGAPLAAVTVVTLDRDAAQESAVIDGELGRVDAERLRVDGRDLLWRDVDWIRFQPRVDGVPRGDELPCVVLADGGWLPARGAAPMGDDRLAVLTPQGRFELALGEFRAWGPSAWLERHASAEAEQDLLVVGEERFAGTVTGIRDGKVMIEIPGLGENAVAWERVTALRLALGSVDTPSVTVHAELLPGRPTVAMIPDVRPRLAVARGQQLARWPAGRLRVMGPRRVWLGALEPSVVEEEGAFGITWPYSVDRNLDGATIRIDGEAYRHGLVLHSRARLSWSLDGAYVRFSTTLGIEDVVGTKGDCSVRISVDGEERWQRDSVRGEDPAVDVAIDCRGAQRLTVEVDYGARYDIADHLALGDAYLVRAGE